MAFPTHPYEPGFEPWDNILEATRIQRQAEETKRVVTLATSAGAKLFLDGDQYCYLTGDDLQSGCAGFGKTPFEAAENFYKNFMGVDNE